MPVYPKTFNQLHPKPQREYRPCATERGYDARWQRARLLFLRRNPLCVLHKMKGEIVPATVVDHKLPHKGDMRLFWDVGNWQALCRACHTDKTGQGQWV